MSYTHVGDEDAVGNKTVSAVTNYPKFSSCKQHTRIISLFCGLEVRLYFLLSALLG